MKKMMILLLGALSLILGLTACNDENEKIDVKLEAANVLYFPRNEYPVIVAKKLPVKFEWAYSKSTDPIFITYEVLFDKADGDFSNPIYAIPSLNNGISPELTVETLVMDVIAKKAGGKVGETVAVKWTVRAQKHKETVVYGGESGVRTILITRSVAEVKLRVMGKATENTKEGVKLGKAMAVENTTGNYSLPYLDGTYECFTELKQGEWYLHDEGNSGYYTLLDNGTIEKAEEAVPSANSYNGKCWLFIDLVQMKWSVREIDKVEFFNGPWFGTSYWKAMKYERNGVWSVTDYAWTIGDGTRYDSRYAVKVTYKNPTLEERWGYRYKDCTDFNNAESDLTFFKVHRYSENDTWHATWKTLNDKQGYNQLATFKFYMNHDKGYYTHERLFKNK